MNLHATDKKKRHKDSSMRWMGLLFCEMDEQNSRNLIIVTYPWFVQLSIKRLEMESSKTAIYKERKMNERTN